MDDEIFFREPTRDAWAAFNFAINWFVHIRGLQAAAGFLGQFKDGKPIEIVPARSSKPSL